MKRAGYKTLFIYVPLALKNLEYFSGSPTRVGLVERREIAIYKYNKSPLAGGLVLRRILF